ncbi:MAG: DUF4136 domain-containing protein [Ramlibacter sp.]
MNRALVKLLGLVMAGTWLLSGCATGYLLDNTVQSFSSLAALPAQPVYRFERLPSQQSPAQAQLEALADAALHKAGLRRDDANPVYSVQVSARLERVLSPWGSPWNGWGWGGGWGMGVRHGGYGYGTGWGWGLGGSYWGMESPWYRREVAVILRELSSTRVVFESHATNDGPWLDDAEVFAAMFEAALQGFPQPPPGPRRVDIPIGR